MTISITSLRKEFPVSSGVEVAVDDINMSIEEGEFISVVGPSGCGKTTTLRCIAGLETPTSGEIVIGGEDVTDIPANKRKLAMMFQNIALYPHMTVEENISYPLKIRGVSRKEQHQQAKEAAEIMQIPELLEKHPGELSGGQRQRAALARTIVQDPEAFLMDEPLSDLDAKLKVEIRKEIQRVHKRVERPTIYVTHDQEEAMTMSDRIFVLNDGQIEQRGTPDELYSEPKNVFVAGFIGNPSMNFLDGKVVDVNRDSISITVEGTQFDFPAHIVGDVSAGDEVVIGFRPEIVNVYPDTEQGDLTGDLSLVERIGDRVLATIDRPSGEVRATVSADNPLDEGEPVSFSFDYSGLHVFDRRTEESIARGTKPRMNA
ncbi:ABC transporter ATP-binding protein [Halopelagius fulvigenes]|uniref:ABC-type D-xylose/L-arabinose transporter n=1 Tax=Halopelagius fulvigenes TaxID=1198324 RepID=A0ABD5TXL8_9EURY